MIFPKFHRCHRLSKQEDVKDGDQEDSNEVDGVYLSSRNIGPEDFEER